MIQYSKDFFINIPKKDIPFWNRSKPYYEQSKEAILFFSQEWEKITKGITIDGVFIHPWLYFHCNFFKTPIPINGVEDIINPFLRDNEWYMAETYQRAEKEGKGIFLYGSRRFSKSVQEASILLWNAVTRPNTTEEIICGSKPDLLNISRFLEVGTTNLHPAFLLPTNKKDWGSHIQFGFKEGGSENVLAHSDIFVKNADAGKEKSSEKGAGGAPASVIFDECGKFAFLNVLLSLKDALETPDGVKAVVLLSGTSGSEKLSRDALKVLSNPTAYNILTMDWDTFESRIDPERITWKRSTFGMYIPSQMAYAKGNKKIESNLKDYLKSNSKELEKIDIQVTDWKLANDLFFGRRKDVENDKTALEKERMYRPLDPEDCFLSGNSNPFPTTEAKLHLQKLRETGNIGKDVELYRKEDGKIGYKLSDKKRAKFPFEGGVHNAPTVLYGELPETKPEYGEFTSGLDDYKQGESTGDSVGSFYVLERKTSTDMPTHLIRMSLATRPTTQEMFYRQAEMGIDAFNAECFVENADIGFIKYLNDKHKADQLLAEGIEWSKSQNANSKATKRWGWHPTVKNKEIIFAKVVSYCHEEIIVGQDENGENIIKLGVEFIPDPDLLQEIIDWKPGINADRIVAFGSALEWADYLTKLNIVPRRETRNITEQREQINKAKILNKGFVPLKKIRK